MQATALLWRPPRSLALTSARPRAAAPRQVVPGRTVAAANPRPRRLLITAAAAASGAGPGAAQRFYLGQPPALPEWKRGSLSSQEQRDEAKRHFSAAAAAAWRPFVQEQYAVLLPIASSLTSFTAVSWEHTDREAVPLRLADFLARLNPQRLQEVTLLLTECQPLPADALAVLAGFPQLRSLSIDALCDSYWPHSPGTPPDEEEVAAAAALGRLTQLTSLRIEGLTATPSVSEAVLSLRNLEQLSLDTPHVDCLHKGLTCAFSGSFPRMRHLELRPEGGTWTAPLPRPADLPGLQSFQYEQRRPADPSTLLVEGPGGSSAERSGHWVQFRGGELALQDTTTAGEGIEDLQQFVDAMLPPGQKLRALVLTQCGQSLHTLGHACRQLAGTTRLELRRCVLDFPALLQQAPKLQELVIEDCTQQSVDDCSEELSLAVLPPGLKSLSLMGTDLRHHQDFPFMPALKQLALSWYSFRSLLLTPPYPLAAATSLRRLRVGETAAWRRKVVRRDSTRFPGGWAEVVDYAGLQLTLEDAEALAAALPGLEELELYNPDSPDPLAPPHVLERLHALMPSLVVRALHPAGGAEP